MFSSYTGTIIRAFFVLVSVVGLWYFACVLAYFFISMIFSLEFSFFGSFLLFLVLSLFRMFYPKNVFA